MTLSRRAVPMLVAALVLASCGTAAPSASPTPVPTSAPTPMSPADQAVLYASIERDVEAIRGLASTRPVNPVLLDEAGLAAELAAHSAEDNPPDVLARRSRLLKALGVIPADADLGAILNAFQAGQIAGFYRPRDGHLYVVSRSGGIGGVERTTFAHEYTHALQDQNFALLQQLQTGTSAAQNGDRDLARLAMIEGDATLVMSVWAQQHLSTLDLLGMLSASLDPGQQAALATMRPFLRETALFPYQVGLQFMTEIQATGGWAAVNSLLRDGPDSTEQLLHPHAGQGLLPVVETLPSDLAGRMGAGWTVESEDTLGEYQIRLWLATTAASTATAPAASAPSSGAAPAGIASPETAAEGWGGDRLAMLQGPNGAWALVIRTIWDTDRDALEFSNAASAVVAGGGRVGRLVDGASPLERWVVIASSAALVDQAQRAATGP